MVLAMIRCIENKNRAWDRDLPLLAMVLHSTVNRNTGFTANKLMVGRETTQPIHLLLGLPNTSVQSKISSLVSVDFQGTPKSCNNMY
jgi:hypothetical protein